jgi:hypothetical protein
MRRSKALLVWLLGLTLAAAGPVAAAAPTRTAYTTRFAEVRYVNDLDPSTPGVHATLIVRHARVVTRTAAGTTTESIVQVISQGYELAQDGGMLRDWYGAYEEFASPADPIAGAIGTSLRSARLAAGPLTFVCYLGECPPLPAQVSVRGVWVATGPQVVTLSHETDDIGTQITIRLRERPADASIVFSGGLVTTPPIVARSVIASQVQTSVAP